MAKYGDDSYDSQVLEDSVLQCKQTFENILCVQTTALLKKSTLEKIYEVLQEFMCKINDSETNIQEVIQSENNLTKTNFKESEFTKRKTNCKAFDNFKALCSENKSPSVKRQNVYKCADCKYQTPRKSDLKKHLKRHMGVCDYCCSYCERKFFDKYNLERHVNASHTKKQQYSCTLCTYTTFLYDSLKRHKKLKHCDHTGAKFVCSVCYHVSASKHDMNVHSYTHDKVKSYMCEECGSMFAIKSRLITHQNTVHNEPVHPCQICDKSFKTLTLLKRHTVIHSRYKPYCCPFCNHSSNSQSNLTKHVRKIHSQSNFSYHKFINGK
ncbi:oocyte zinc finger protein XlCOF26-like isoform X2 [Metopolophium dirhodum]|uniref:oocyte zinc finger protein XlCOF26-like isoform X2 n=2 Tax=Metopolophium dirhodum TaxID=44670 RepID=UPI00298FF436|nr:oocyte zinc finger protein XlCOF26-like isoform X2 [Metopolophium dirhodum]